MRPAGAGPGLTLDPTVVGARKVARFILGLLRLYGDYVLISATPVLVNGDLGLFVPAGPRPGERTSVARRVNVIAVRDGKIAAVYDIVNPDKLTRLPLEYASS